MHACHSLWLKSNILFLMITLRPFLFLLIIYNFIKILTLFFCCIRTGLVFPSGNVISNLVRCISGASQLWLLKMGVVGGRSLFCCNLRMQINIFDGFQWSYYLWKVYGLATLCAWYWHLKKKNRLTYMFIVCSATLARLHLYAEEEKKLFGCGAERFWVAFMADDPNSRPVITTASSPYLECGNSSAETPWYDKESMLRVPKYLILVEVVSKLYYGFKTRLELY